MSILLLLSVIFCLVAGRSIDTGAVCLVRASGDIVTGKFGLAVGLLVTLACSAAIFYAIGALSLRPQPVAWADPTLLTIAGATVFAWGILINGACAVGTIGRLARGEIGFLVTLGAGILVSLSVPRTMLAPRPRDLPVLSGWEWPAVITVAAVLAVLAIRGNVGGRGLRTYILLGIALALVTNWQGDWTWLRVAEELQHRAHIPITALACLAALFVGAAISAVVAGHWRLVRPHWPTLVREAIGGAMMAAGALLIPGGNDTLMAYGLPSGSPHALLAYILIVSWLLLIMWLMPKVRAWRLWTGMTENA
jgi:uncharacterized protein